MIDKQLQECIKAAHKAGLQNAEQLSRDSVLIRFVQLCSWYSQIQKERNNLLEALESIINADDEAEAMMREMGIPAEEPMEIFVAARAAIAKAKGDAQ